VARLQRRHWPFTISRNASPAKSERISLLRDMRST
jgi:hypothetical protein